jgi:hypothetical protein
MVQSAIVIFHRSTFGLNLKMRQLLLLGCEMCGAVKGRRSDMVLHMKRVHMSTDICQCDICGVLRSDVKLLRMHLCRTHAREHTHGSGHTCLPWHNTKEKAYKCELCSSSFSYPDNLTSHIRFKHVRERSFQCDVCPTAFRCASNEKIAAFWM